MQHPRLVRYAPFIVALMLLPGKSFAAFPDVPKSNFAYDAIEYLSQRKIITGYKDGTFQPDRKVGRAEALKIIAATFVTNTEDTSKSRAIGFADVPDGAWYIPYLEWTLGKGNIVDPPSKNKNFAPANPVKKAEFLKMLFATHGVDLKSFNDILLPLSTDVTDTRAWYYPMMRYAVATTTTVPTDSGHLMPDRELTRADVALLLYRFTLYREELRVQAQLSAAQKEVENIINALSDGNIRAAEYASARGLLFTRSAIETSPDEPTVKVAVKIAEGYRALTRAYRASLSGDADEVIKLSGDAFFLGDQAVKMSPVSESAVKQLKNYSQSFAQQARASK